MDIFGVFVLFVFYFDAGCLPFIFHSMQGTQSPGISRLVCGLGSKRRGRGKALSSAGEDDKETGLLSHLLRFARGSALAENFASLSPG